MRIVDVLDEVFLVLSRIHAPCPADDSYITLGYRIACNLEG